MTKIIKAVMPKGFRLVVQESFQAGLDNVFVFVNPKGQKLYLKMLPYEEILKGRIWEILSPSQLKVLKIEESYNAELYDKDAYSVEESAEEDLWNPEKETLEEYKKRKGIKGDISAEGIKELTRGEVHIHVGDNPKETGEEENFETKFGKGMLETLKTKCMALGVEYEEPRSMSDVILLKTACDEASQGIGDPDSLGASGQATIEQRTGKVASRGFETSEEMIEFLLVKSHSGDAEERKEAKAVLDELVLKMSRAIKSGKLPRGINYEEKGEESIIGKYKRIMNRIQREKVRERVK